jgi:hypothetical protein
LHRGTGVLPMMEYAEHFDFLSSGLVKVDDVLLYLDAAASGKQIVPWPTGLGMPGEHVQCLVDHSSIGRLLRLPPCAARVQQDV